VSNLEIAPLGDTAVVIRFGNQIDIHTHQKVQTAMAALEAIQLPGVIECIPAYTSVTVLYDPFLILKHAPGMIGMDHAPNHTAYDIVHSVVREIIDETETFVNHEQRVVSIPVCYGGEFGPDINFVADINQLTVDEVIQIHTSCDYLVYMIGFAPGFPYLGGMSKRIATPRKPTPRLSIPAGSVGIAGTQTGVYPFSTPGGWQLIGQTPVALFDPSKMPPSLLKAGDVVRFYSISESEFHDWKDRET
jgi:inhibitor of KinA